MMTKTSPRRAFLGRLAAVVTGGTWLSGTTSVRAAQAAPQADDPYVGEIRMFGGLFAPSGWMLCEGQLLSIQENETLFTLIGTSYGGDGQDTFALPDLRGRAPIHQGGGYILAETGGQETVMLGPNQIPAHTHTAQASSSAGTSDSPAGHAPARNAAGQPRYGALADTNMAGAALLTTGGSVAHDNMQPYLGISFIISLFGQYPTP